MPTASYSDCVIASPGPDPDLGVPLGILAGGLVGGVALVVLVLVIRHCTQEKAGTRESTTLGRNSTHGNSHASSAVVNV